MLHLGIFIPYSGLFDNTRILSLTHALACRGVTIDIFTVWRQEFDTAPVSDLHRHIQVYELAEGLSPAGLVEESFFSANTELIPEIIIRRLINFAENRFYDYIIGVDPVGLVYARWFAHRTRARFAYLIHSSWTRYKKRPIIFQAYLDVIEQSAHNFLSEIDLLIIPDGADKQNFLPWLKEQKESLPTIMPLPSAVLDYPLPVETMYWHKRFQISPERRIVLVIGDFHYPFLERRLFPICQKIDDMIFIFHGRIDVPNGQSSIGDNIFFSTQVVQWKEVPLLMGSADIGLLWGPRAHLPPPVAAYASSAIAYFAQYGIPMIFYPPWDSFRDFVTQFHPGIVLRQPDDLPKAMRHIIDNYLYFSSGARDAYEQKLNMQLYADQLREYIRDLSTQDYQTHSDIFDDLKEEDLNLAKKIQYDLLGVLGKQ